MYEDRSIAWMMSGGNRAETAHQRLDHLHLRALREANASAPGRGLAIRPFLTRAMASIGLAASSVTATPTNPDCCAA